jgi:hypothetical protein
VSGSLVTAISFAATKPQPDPVEFFAGEVPVNQKLIGDIEHKHDGENASTLRAFNLI